MSNISKCENCGCEKIDVIHKYKGHYVCPKCGRDTERLYEIEHDAEIRAKAIDEFAEALVKHTHKIPSRCLGGANVLEIAEQMKAGAENE